MTEVKRYRKKPVEVEAFQISADGTIVFVSVTRNLASVVAASGWMLRHGFKDFKVVPAADDFVGISITTLVGDMLASPGDYIIRGVQGEFYPCTPDIFAKTYEEVTDD